MLRCALASALRRIRHCSDPPGHSAGSELDLGPALAKVWPQVLGASLIHGFALTLIII